MYRINIQRFYLVSFVSWSQLVAAAAVFCSPIFQLTGRINKCGVISPRFDMPLHDTEKWVNNLLPARGVSARTVFPLLYIVSTVHTSGLACFCCFRVLVFCLSPPNRYLGR